jgi:hypothetical protein
MADMGIDVSRVSDQAMALMDYLQEGYPDGELVGVVLCAAVREASSSGGEQHIRYVTEPPDRDLAIDVVYTVMRSLERGEGEAT